MEFPCLWQKVSVKIFGHSRSLGSRLHYLGTSLRNLHSLFMGSLCYLLLVTCLRLYLSTSESRSSFKLEDASRCASHSHTTVLIICESDSTEIDQSILVDSSVLWWFIRQCYSMVNDDSSWIRDWTVHCLQDRRNNYDAIPITPFNNLIELPTQLPNQFLNAVASRNLKEKKIRRKRLERFTHYQHTVFPFILYS